ncbi:MAG: DUF2911 domain-containing protein [Gemmatimonadaceae bacterium]|nr:DUF2911 domain-containing protein [Gemmatimonadaceae bacterium]
MRLHAAILAPIVFFAGAVGAQSTLRSAPSTRATVEVALSTPRPQGATGAAPAPHVLRIEYGQPHARGRTVAGALPDDLNKIWRLGANTSTTLKTDVDLVIGGTVVPKGLYSLYAETSAQGPWKLIINTNTGQWGTEYVAERDHARVPLTGKTLATPVESLSITLVPGAEGAPRGDLRIMWGTREFTTTWAVR